MGILTVVLFLAQASSLERAQDARAEAEALFGAIEGVRVVGLGGAGGDFRIIVSCPDAAAKAEARTLAGGDAVGGVKILWRVGPVPEPKAPPAKAELPPAPVPLPEAPLKGEVTGCDIIRDYLKLKPVHHPIGNGRSLIPCQLVRRSVVGPGGGHTYVYTKHRSDCPIRLGRVSQPEWADNFVGWVFQKGFTPVMRAGFTWPNELRADDKLWDAQAKNELMTRLPYIREGAEWTYTNSQYTKVTTPWYSGWYSTGGSPGVGWAWRDPVTAQNAGTPRPAPSGPWNPYLPPAGFVDGGAGVVIPVPLPPKNPEGGDNKKK